VAPVDLFQAVTSARLPQRGQPLIQAYARCMLGRADEEDGVTYFVSMLISVGRGAGRALAPPPLPSNPPPTRERPTPQAPRRPYQP
jgi:hypothetical protein